MSDTESELPAGEIAKPGCYVKMQMLKDGVYTWVVLANEGMTVVDLRAVKDVVAEICHELEAEFPHGPVEETGAPRRGYR